MVAFIRIEITHKTGMMKKNNVIWGILIVVAISCSGPKGIVKVAETDNGTAADSTEYELLTFDTRFETWYNMNNSPVNYRSQAYYESWNKRYVSAWNSNANDPHQGSFFEPIVGYDYSTDYGFELNHKLFYYFQYVEHKLKIPILDIPGPNIALIN